MIQITTTAWNEKNNKIKRGHWSVGSSDQASTREFDQWVDWSGTSQSRQKDMVYIWPVLLFLRICVCVCPTFKAIDTRKNGWINLWKMKEEWNRFHGAWPLLSFPSFFLVFLLSFSQRKNKKQNNIHFHELLFTTGLFYFSPTLPLNCCLLPLFENGVWNSLVTMAKISFASIRKRIIIKTKKQRTKRKSNKLERTKHKKTHVWI